MALDEGDSNGLPDHPFVCKDSSHRTSYLENINYFPFVLYVLEFHEVNSGRNITHPNAFGTGLS